MSQYVQVKYGETFKTFGLIAFSIMILVFSQSFSNLVGALAWQIGLPAFLCNIIVGGLQVILAYYLLKILCRFYLKGTMEQYGIPKIKFNKLWVIIAIIFPIVVRGIYLVLPGSYELPKLEMAETLSIITGSLFITGIAAGVVEEWIFRGVIMYLIAKRANKLLAIILPALMYGVWYVVATGYKGEYTFWVIGVGVLVGVVYALITIVGKSTWNSIIVHVMWNLVIMNGVFYVHIESNPYAICTYVLKSKSVWLTGGEFGISVSVISILGYLLVGAVAYLQIQRKLEKMSVMNVKSDESTME